MPLRLLRRPFFWIIALVIAVFALVPAIGSDVQLRESLLQGGLHGRNFLRPEIALHGCFRPLDRGLGRALIDCSPLQRHIGQDGNGVAGDLSETFSDGERRLAAFL